MIVCEDIRKSYPLGHGTKIVLDGIDLVIRPGERVGFLGRNGAGKTTLIKLIGAVEYPTSGKVTRGMSVSWPLGFGGGFQGSLTGYDNARFIARIYGRQYSEIREFVEDFTELGRQLSMPVKTYSSGMRARLAFAISMVIEFDCFLIDEIVAVGDARFHEKCMFELFEKRRDRAKIIVSHQPKYIRDHCTRASVLAGAKLHHFDDLDSAFAFYSDAPAPNLQAA